MKVIIHNVIKSLLVKVMVMMTITFFETKMGKIKVMMQ